MIRFISSMSSTMPARVASSRASISMPRRSRASGVRRSWETPASSSARSCSSWARLAAIRFTPRFRVDDLRGAVLGQRRRRLAAADALDRRAEFAQRPREVAGEGEGGGQQHRGEDQAPQRRARRMVLRLRARRKRKADPVTGARGFDPHEKQAATRRHAQLGAGAERFAQARLERFQQRRDRSAAA